MKTSASAIMVGGATPLAVVWEDEYYFALAKPAGLHTVGATADLDQGPSVSQILCQSLPALAHIGSTASNGGLLQRLDMDTSGIVLGAKTDEAWARFRDLYSLGGVEKTYRVALDGILHHTVKIDAAIGSPYRRASKVRVYDPRISREEGPETARSSGSLSAAAGSERRLQGNLTSRQKGKGRAQPARTTFAPGAINIDQSLTIALASTTTGRRHQVRAHAAALGHPLCGDDLYGSARDLFEILPGASSGSPLSMAPADIHAPAQLPRFLLHAEKVSFGHPFTGQAIRVSLSAESFPGWLLLRGAAN